MRITPYTVQVVYMESSRMAKQEITLETFLLRCDLLNMKEFARITKEEGNQYQVITTSLMEVIKLDKVISEAPNAMVNYMKGINTGIRKTDDLLRESGELSMKNYLDSVGFGSNPIIKYIFLTLTGRYDLRNNMDKNKIKQFILERTVKGELPALNDILGKLNSELEQIEDIINTKQKVEATLDLNSINKTIESINRALVDRKPEVNIKGLEEIKGIESELFEILKQSQTQEKITVDVTESINSTMNKYKETIEYIDSSLNRSNVNMKQSLDNQKGIVSNLNEGKNKVSNSLKQAQENFEQMVKLQGELDIEGIISDVEKIVNTNKGLREHTSEQASLIQGVSVRIVHVQKSLQILEEVMENLNKLVRREAVLGLAQTESQVNKITNKLGGM